MLSSAGVMLARRLPPVVLVGPCIVVGCLPITEVYSVRETTVATREEIRALPGAGGVVREIAVSAFGSTLELEGVERRRCVATPVDVVDREARVERTSPPGTLWREWFGASAAAAGAIALFAVSGTVDNRSEPLAGGGYSPPERDYFVAWGITSTALAAVLTTIALTHSIQSRDSVEDLPTEERPRPAEIRDCEVRPLAGVAVFGRLGDRTFHVADLGDDGTAHIDLLDVVPADATAGSPRPHRLELRIGEETAGVVPGEITDALIGEFDARAFAEAERAGTAEAFERFVAERPHAAKAGAAARRAEQLRTEAEWEAAQRGGRQELAAFIDRRPAASQAPLALSRLIDLCLDAGDIDEAMRHLAVLRRSWPDAPGVGDLTRRVAARVADWQQQRLQEEEALRQAEAEAEARRRRAEERARDAAAGAIRRAAGIAARCAGTGRGDDVSLAREAYEALRGAEGRVGEGQLDRARMSVMARCACSPTCAGVP